MRRENEKLRREIWTLRDECDRLNKRFKAKLSEHEYGGCRGSGGSGRRCSGGGRGSAGCDGNSDVSSRLQLPRFANLIGFLSPARTPTHVIRVAATTMATAVTNAARRAAAAAAAPV